jgi:hypothetical protein
MWDPGGKRGAPNNQLLQRIMVLSSEAMEEDATDEICESRTELDTHANMCVFGQHCLILRWTGRNAEVNPFTPDYEALQKVPIVDAAILYECPVTGKEFILVARNVLYVKSMDINLIPPFILREAGIKVNDVPKIQVDDPTEQDHAIIFKRQELLIPLGLVGIFSYFVSRAPTEKQVLESDDVFLLTPDAENWNPHSDAYARNEENMVDWEGNMVEPKD